MPEQTPQASGRNQAVRTESVQAPRILVAVVDDEPVIRTLAARMIGHTWPEVDVAAGGSGADAVDLRVASCPPDLMLVNGVMPGIPGPDAIAAIRRLEVAEGWPRVPIVITSGSTEMLAKGRAAGADAELATPYTPQQLLGLVAGLLGLPEPAAWPGDRTAGEVGAAGLQTGGDR